MNVIYCNILFLDIHVHIALSNCKQGGLAYMVNFKQKIDITKQYIKYSQGKSLFPLLTPGKLFLDAVLLS